MAASDTPVRSPWLHGPASDLLLGGGLIYVPVFVALVAAGDTFQAALPLTLMPLLMLVFNSPHLGGTLLRAYERPEDRRRYRLFAVHATLFIVAWCLLGFYVPIFGSILITVYLTVIPWHFTGQNYGIALIFLRRNGVNVSRELKSLLYVSFVSTYFMTLVSLHSDSRAALTPVDPSGTVYTFLSLHLPNEVLVYGLAFLGAAYAASLVGLALQLRHFPLRDVLPATALLFSQALWFSAPILIQLLGGGAEGLWPFAGANYAYTATWLALAHAVQYVWITTYYAARERAPSGPATYLAKSTLAGAAIYGFPMLLLGTGLIGRVPYDLGLAVLALGAINLHHVMLDSAIWKLRSGPLARILIDGRQAQEAGTELPASRPFLDSRWILGAALISGALGVVLVTATTLETEFGYERALRRGDVARLEVSAQRFSWLGRESPKTFVAIGALRAEQGDLDGALRTLERSIDVSPTADAWTRIGRVQEQRDSRGSALDAYQQALAVDPEYVPALYHAGRLALAQGDRAQARAWLESANQLFPGDESIRAALAASRAAE